MGKGRDKRKKAKGVEPKAKKDKGSGDFDSDEDIDGILEEYTAELSRMAQGAEERTESPSPRANASIVLNPLNSSEMFLFGGECSNGERNYYYADMFKFNLERQVWKRIASPKSPRPRSSHQMAACSNGKMLLFGGEFGSPNDTRFLHHRDCWTFDPKAMIWEELDVKGPPARSGHRMVSWRNYIVLFGGFVDDGKQTKYLDDLWMFDHNNMSWTKLSPKGERPSPRSGFVFVSCEEGAVLYGGYHVERDSKGHSEGRSLNDLWVLHMPRNAEETVRWEKLRTSNSPSLRSGCSFCLAKNLLVIFGGIVDEEVGDEYIHGVCQNDMYTLDLNRKCVWKKIECRGAAPIGRFNSMMVSTGKDVYVIGGIVEAGDLDVFLDDIWSVHVGTDCSWRCVNQLTVDIPNPTVSTASDVDEEETGDSSDGSDPDYASEEDDTSDADSTLETDDAAEFPPPHADESLKEYYDRNVDLFMRLVAEHDNAADEKTIRKTAFLAAKDFFDRFGRL